jgi:hypothetical protein
MAFVPLAGDPFHLNIDSAQQIADVARDTIKLVNVDFDEKSGDFVFNEVQILPWEKPEWVEEWAARMRTHPSGYEEAIETKEGWRAELIKAARQVSKKFYNGVR